MQIRSRSRFGRHNPPKFLSKCMRGPVIRVSGSSVTVLDYNKNFNEKQKRIQLRPKNWPPTDVLKSEEISVCSFCQKSSYPGNGLGCLFGPYNVGDQGWAWVHLDCVLWVPCVNMIGGVLQNLAAGIKDCREVNCEYCGNIGASLCCSFHGCRSSVHIVCGRENNWELDEENLTAVCSEHKLDSMRNNLVKSNYKSLS